MSTPAAIYEAVRAAALGYPAAYEEAPWGHSVVKVNKKIFVFASLKEDRAAFSLKLPTSSEAALESASAAPMGYGMGKHGWVSFTFHEGDAFTLDTFTAWLDESFRAVAPKKLLKAIDAGEPMPEPPKPPALEGVVALIGADPLRLARARACLDGGGLTVVSADLEDAIDVAGDAEPDLVVVDVCRSSRDAIALLPDVGLVCVDAQLVVVGVQSAKMERSLEAKLPRGTRFSREAPGDPKVHTLVSGLLGVV